MKDLISFYKNKRVFITGHTGFKGTWLTRILLNAGAFVTGYALEPPTEPNLFDISGVKEHSNLVNIIGDIRNLEYLKNTFKKTCPQIVFHLAAQPLVRESYRNPVKTYTTNVIGTVNVLECVRTTLDSNGSSQVRSVLNVTTDKVYENKEWCWGYRESDILNGHDPYSNSKSCSELVTHSYSNSYFGNHSVRISTARAGNVIGGGDFANDRIIPDCVRSLKSAYQAGKDRAVIGIRNPYSIRPYQHVLEPVTAYLLIAMKQYHDASFSGQYNIGPDECDCITTGDLVDLFCSKYNEEDGFPKASWKNVAEKNAPHEASFLKLDCSRIKNKFGWHPCWHIEKAVKETVRFSKVWMKNGDIIDEMDREIEEYMK